MAEYTLPPLPYDYGALEPHISARTMQFHHDKHHQTYVTNLNNALKDHPEHQGKSIEELLANISACPIAPVGSPPPPGFMICQNIEWLACPPPLFRTAVRIPSGRASSRAISSSTGWSWCWGWSFSAALRLLTYVWWCLV